MGPLIYLSKLELWTIAIGLRGFQGHQGVGVPRRP